MNSTERTNLFKLPIVLIYGDWVRINIFETVYAIFACILQLQ